MHSLLSKGARRGVTERLNLYFADLREALDPDTEDFFQRVMQQAEKYERHASR